MFTLHQAFEAVKDRTEFVVKELQDTICLDYIVVLQDSFNDPKYGWIRRNFRGITFCKHTQNLLSLPFHKFYNINQNQESQFNLHQHKHAAVYEKLDGSMIHFYRKTNGELVASTCRSPESLQAKEAMAFAQTQASLLNLIDKSLDNGFTPMFEWCAPHNQIVVRYDSCRLVYLMSRQKSTGKYVFESNYEDRASQYSIPFSQIFDHTHRSDFEGYVCHLSDGEIYKVKTPWYIERHRSVDLLMKPKYKIYELALNNVLDDIISVSPDTHQKTFRLIDDEVKQDLLHAKIDLQKEFDLISEELGDNSASDYRKRFALVAKDRPNFSALMMILSGKSPDPVVKKRLISEYTIKYPYKLML